VLTGTRLILSEGTSDEALLRALIDTRKLPEFCIRNGSDLPGDNSGGISMIGRLLAGIIIWKGFAAITDILIVVDSDFDPIDNFREVCSQIRSVTEYSYPIPKALLDRAKGPPTITVMTVPWIDQPGNLEALCLPVAVKTSTNLAACVEAFAECAKVNTWALVRKRDAMRLRSLLAVAHRSNPFIGLGQVWRDAKELIPVMDSQFDRIASVLEGYR
jgi:hypothetical protein